MFKKIALLTIFVVIILSGCGKKKVSDTDGASMARMPKFTLPLVSADGAISDRAIKDPAVFLFVSDWCAPCHRELDKMVNLQKRYGKLNIYIFVLDKGTGTKAYLDSIGAGFPIIKADSALVRAMGVRSIPTRMLISDRTDVVSIVGTPSYKEPDFNEKVRTILGIEPVEPFDTSDKHGKKGEK